MMLDSQDIAFIDSSPISHWRSCS